MFKPSSAVAALLFLLAVPTAHAVCSLNLRLTDPSTLAWDNVAGAKTYELQESFDNRAHSRNYFLTATTFRIDHRASTDTKVVYIVTALMDSSVLSVSPLSDGCTESVIVTLKGDPQFRALTRKAVVPIAGSAAGAFGGRFKTSLKLTTSGGNQRGRIVFHPAGSIASAADPSMPYSVGGSPGESLVIDDVVGRLGASGIGSLDIIPDDDTPAAVPTVEARLYNDTSGGTFGTTTPAFYPFDYLQAPALTFELPAAAFRLNLGIRTLTATTANALIYGLNGRLRDFTEISFPADYTILAPVSQIIGKDVQAGEFVILYFKGAAIPFYTVTENRTNDPELFVARPEQSTDVGSYVE